MNMWRSLGVLWLGAALVMVAGWRWQRRRSNAGIVDVLWAAGLGSAALLLGLVGEGALLPRALVAAAGGFWGARLALHLWNRVSREPEDGRYQYLRAHWQGSQLKFFGFFQFQALLIALFALPFAAVARNRTGTFTPWMAIGLILWVVSLVGESVADAQLRRFRSDLANRGRTCDRGLWRFSRHPNYFFEWLHWWTYVGLAVGSPVAWLSGVGPVLMYVFLRWVSGVPFTEAQALRTRGEEYRRYQKRTSVFFPWFPKRSVCLTQEQKNSS